MYYETNCTQVSLSEWERLTKGARKCSYKKLVKLIKENIPELYDNLVLNFPNPFANYCKQTKTHYILNHSGIEYFIHK